MKTSILLFIFACFGFHSFGQYARSVHSDNTPTGRHASIFKANGKTTILNIRESSNDTLRVMLMDIDENGETDNYRMFEHSPFDMSTWFVLSGVGTTSSGEVVLNIQQYDSGPTMDIDYLTLDPNSGAFTDEFSLNSQYKRAVSRSRQKGDSLITYVAQNGTAGITRLARSLSNTTIATESFISNGTFASPFTQNQIACELILHNSEEYIGVANLVIKRTSTNNYIEASYSGSTTCPALVETPSGNMFVLNKNFASENL
ncbi:MAG: hypothetical protein AB8B56_13350, partial [Crocinitomicaceae bacterium]